MANTTASLQSREFANRAIMEALIGMLRMAAERGDPRVIRVEYRTESEAITMSPYGLYADHDQDRLVIFTGQPGQETFIIPRETIVSIKLEYPSEIVRRLNALAPSACEEVRLCG